MKTSLTFKAPFAFTKINLNAGCLVPIITAKVYLGDIGVYI